MNSYPVAAIQSGAKFTDKVFLDTSFLLLDSEIPFTGELKKRLGEWNFTVVYSDGVPRNPGVSQPSHSPAPAESSFEKPKEPAVSEPKKEIPKAETAKKNAPKNVEYESIDINDLLGLPSQVVAPPPPVPDVPIIDDETESQKKTEAPATSGETDESSHFDDEAKKIEQLKKNSETTRMNHVKATYDEYMEYVNTVYTRYATHKKLEQNELTETVKSMCVFIKDNKRYVLRVMPYPENVSKNFLVSHSLRSTIISITIGLTLHLPLTKLVELGVACLVHEIGQIRLPPQLYITDRLLTSAQKQQLSTHPIIGYNILKEHNFPLTIQLGVLEHHERENGTGYPRHLTGDKISSYAKIISVACSFEAITAPRHFREARSSYEAMLEMLQNHDHAYDETVIKALLFSFSLFPIGAYVALSNGRIAQVTDVNPKDPRNPIVQCINEITGNLEPQSVTTDNNEMKVIRVLNKQEVDVIKQQQGSSN